MDKSRFTEEQITFVLTQAETGTPVTEVLRRMGLALLNETCFHPQVREPNRRC